jgi:hypothetical protein
MTPALLAERLVRGSTPQASPVLAAMSA